MISFSPYVRICYAQRREQLDELQARAATLDEYSGGLGIADEDSIIPPPTISTRSAPPTSSSSSSSGGGCFSRLF
jgi:hypothetical protein